MLPSLVMHLCCSLSYYFIIFLLFYSDRIHDILFFLQPPMDVHLSDVALIFRQAAPAACRRWQNTTVECGTVPAQGARYGSKLYSRTFWELTRDKLFEFECSIDSRLCVGPKGTERKISHDYG